ncbi:MAG TPA: zinc ribbon domain-containing protein [Polyangiaceae bacterium]|nr:zinc ribbon domain-containing protein [Polyangiaceae bacterium]
MKLKSFSGPGALVGLIAVTTLLTAVVSGIVLGLGTALLVVAGGALAAVLVLLWASVQSLAGETPLTLDEAIGMGAPSAEEEQKRAVLRALKDLEYERSVGKISEEDYREFLARYRAEARRLIAAVDESLGPAHALAEKLLAERLARAGLADAPDAKQPESEAASSPENGAPVSPEPKSEAPGETSADASAESAMPDSAEACAGCGTLNDADARFCKRCGRSLELASAAQESDS